MPLTQDNRPFSIKTPLGKDVLLLETLEGTEGVSQLFRFQVVLASEVSPAIAFDDIVGKNVTITLQHPGGPRYINGIVSRFASGRSTSSLTGYYAEIVPWLWLLTQTADCRIFQNMPVPDIIRKVFTDLGFTDVKLALRATYPPREYCVQYRETDFNFVSRLMEQYGIFYFFEHGDGKHTLVLADTPAGCPSCAPDSARFDFAAGGHVLPDDVVDRFSKEQTIRPGKYALTDYNYVTPRDPLDVKVGSVFKGGEKLEVYDYPGEYSKRNDGEALVRVRIQEEEAGRQVATGGSGCRQFTAGHTFRLTGHGRKDLNDTYMLVSVSHVGSETYESGVDASDHLYSNTFSCIPLAIPYRPPRTTPRPVIQGSQTAEVVGVKGEEIYTDKYGRVKVQFHWDREGKKDENSSCWIRVSHPWAGKGWGSVSIPRIGQEVIVDFLEGDPDQPIITGRVYNGELMPPYTLPAGGVVSGVKSNSTKGGGGYNEIALDDTKGKELIRIHGQYDMKSLIEHDRNEIVGNNESISIDGNRTESVGKNESISIGANRTESVDGDEGVSIGKNRSLSVAKSENIDVGEDRTDSVKRNAHLKIGDSRTEKVGKDDSLDVGKNLMITAGDTVTIKTGDASIVMKKNGEIVIKGKDIKVEGSGKIAIKASSDVTIKGSKVSTN